MVWAGWIESPKGSLVLSIIISKSKFGILLWERRDVFLVNFFLFRESHVVFLVNVAEIQVSIACVEVHVFLRLENVG